MAKNFYETREDFGDTTSDDGTGVDAWADWGAPTTGASFDVSGESFSAAQSIGSMGKSGPSCGEARFSGVLGQSGLAS